MPEGPNYEESPSGEFQYSKKPSKWWYLLPIVLGLLGGIAAYLLVQDRDKEFAKKLLIAGIVMTVIIWLIATVSLIAFSYMQFTQITKEGQESVASQIEQYEKSQQGVFIPTVYQYSSDICFQVKASKDNKYNLNPKKFSYFINGNTRNIVAWDGGVNGESCSSITSLEPGNSCFGKIKDYSCSEGDMFKVSTEYISANETIIC